MSPMIDAIDDGEEDRDRAILAGDWEVNCYTCKHLNADGQTCLAYPQGIPRRYRTGHQRHDEPRNGVAWEAK